MEVFDLVRKAAIVAASPCGIRRPIAEAGPRRVIPRARTGKPHDVTGQKILADGPAAVRGGF
ncbi:hypothetical protein [Sphingobium subterraneum]|uniref:Uncharacterized protein n=1 Tax=Sphingobium subterraneum TaxID=627688 RepID=A0A841IVL7_9SPHN|nr:hypothetical protein [Sphingobium subterraneum]MBB6122384.1 hypothetical protein [Sphingobium subterraneum]